MSISVLTLNLWNIEGPLEARYSALARGLKLLRPDIVCLEEVSRDPQSVRSQTELIAEYCNLAHCAEKDELSILSRYPVVGSDSAAVRYRRIGSSCVPMTKTARLSSRAISNAATPLTVPLRIDIDTHTFG